MLIDDLQRLDDSAGIEAALKHRDRVLLAVSRSARLPRQPDGRDAQPARRSRPACCWRPTGSLDGSAIGLRRLPAEWTTNPRPGRGILGIAGDPTEVQVPLITVDA